MTKFGDLVAHVRVLALIAQHERFPVDGFVVCDDHAALAGGEGLGGEERKASSVSEKAGMEAIQSGPMSVGAVLNQIQTPFRAQIFENFRLWADDPADMYHHDRGGVVLNPSRYVFGVETQSFPVRVGENNLIVGVGHRQGRCQEGVRWDYDRFPLYAQRPVDYFRRRTRWLPLPRTLPR